MSDKEIGQEPVTMTEEAANPIRFAAPAVPQMIVTREQARARRKQSEEIGDIYELPVTGGIARVRTPSLMDATITGALPNSVQGEVSSFIQDVVSRGTGSGAGDVLAMINRRQKLADELCIVCFLEPKLFRSDDKLDAYLAQHPDDQTAMTVEDLDPSERIGLLIACMEMMGGIGDAKLRTFRGRPVGNVPPQSDEQATA